MQYKLCWRDSSGGKRHEDQSSSPEPKLRSGGVQRGWIVTALKRQKEVETGEPWAHRPSSWLVPGLWEILLQVPRQRNLRTLEADLWPSHMCAQTHIHTHGNNRCHGYPFPVPFMSHTLVCNALPVNHAISWSAYTVTKSLHCLWPSGWRITLVISFSHSKNLLHKYFQIAMPLHL